MKFVVSPSESDINRKECIDFNNDRYSRMLNCYDFSDDKQFLMTIFKVFCYYVENILVKGFEYKEVLQQRETGTMFRKLQYIGQGQFAKYVCADIRDSYYEYDEYEEVSKYVDMKRLRFRKGINQSAAFEYLKKYKLLAGIE